MQRQTVLFEGSGVLSNDLWETNGTAAGTRQLTGISGASVSGVFPQGGFRQARKTHRRVLDLWQLAPTARQIA
jgi:hypothetical protein